jgi:hypothetical protein
MAIVVFFKKIIVHGDVHLGWLKANMKKKLS